MFIGIFVFLRRTKWEDLRMTKLVTPMMITAAMRVDKMITFEGEIKVLKEIPPVKFLTLVSIVNTPSYSSLKKIHN